MRERKPLIAWIRQLRRASKTPDEAARRDAAAPQQDELYALQERLTHLEALVQALQDSVHRESSRHVKRISELEARVQPVALSKALSDDARARGL